MYLIHSQLCPGHLNKKTICPLLYYLYDVTHFPGGQFNQVLKLSNSWNKAYQNKQAEKKSCRIPVSRSRDRNSFLEVGL